MSEYWYSENRNPNVLRPSEDDYQQFIYDMLFSIYRHETKFTVEKYPTSGFTVKLSRPGYEVVIKRSDVSKAEITLNNLSKLGLRILRQIPAEHIKDIASSYGLDIIKINENVITAKTKLFMGESVESFIEKLYDIVNRIENGILEEFVDSKISAYIISKELGDKHDA